MSNKKHPDCAIRNIAKESKKRLIKNMYHKQNSPFAPPKDVSPSQKEIYIKICEIYENGQHISNPIQQFANKEKIETLSHGDRQRYILELSSDYISMKHAFDQNLIKYDKAPMD